MPDRQAVFIHAFSTPYLNPTLVISTLHDYNVDTVAVEMCAPHFARYPSVYAPYTIYFDWPLLLEQASNVGIEVYLTMNVLAENNMSPAVDYMTQRANRTLTGGLCPNKPLVRTRLKHMVEELATNYPTLSGFMFDYYRYVWGDACFCEYCHQQFEADLALGVDWQADVISGGANHADWVEWRADNLTDLMAEMEGWMTAINPALKYTAAVWNNPGTGVRTYWKTWIGQDGEQWAADGLLDWTSPMFYVDDVAKVTAWTNTYIGWLGGSAPCIPFIDTCADAQSTPANVAARITAIRDDTTADGWILWRYGGPGDADAGYPPPLDVTDIFDILAMGPVGGGWDGTILGVPGPSNVMGVPGANIASILGVTS